MMFNYFVGYPNSQGEIAYQLLQNPDEIFDWFRAKLNEKQESNEHALEVKFILLKAHKVDLRFKVELVLPEDECVRRIIEPFPHFTYKSFSPVFYIIYTNKRSFLFNTRRCAAHCLFNETTSNKLAIEFIIDAPFLHPSWNYELKQRRSSADPEQPVGTNYVLDVNIISFLGEKSIVPFQQSVYPKGMKSAFILTDHCDFDTVQKLKIFLYGRAKKGWLGRGLKITKGVFALGPKEGEPVKNASLEEQDYLNLITDLYNDGSEIVPHALKSKGQLTSAEFQQAIEKMDALFKPKTWIDHGSYLKYCYSQGGKENKNYLLVETLQKYGYNNLWSFHDVNLDASQTLNIFTRKSLHISKPLSYSFINLIKGRWLVSAHYLRIIIHRNYSKNIVTEYLMYAMAGSKGIFINLKNKRKRFFKDASGYLKGLFQFHQVRNKIPVPYANKDVRNYSSFLYLEDRRPINQYSNNNLLMFYTFETTHLTDIYNKRALENLIKEYGTHVGHTYILNDLPYINSIFKNDSGVLALQKKWIQFLDLLENKVSTNEVWNPNMSEYVDRVIKLLNVSIYYITERCVQIINANNSQVEGYTFLIPNSYSSQLYINDVLTNATSSDIHYHFFVIDLTASSIVKVRCA